MMECEQITGGIQVPQPWQQSAWQQLVSQQRSGRLAHAYLLQARAGSGRRQFAQALASWLLCERVATQSSACGECAQCLLQVRGPHPDLMVVIPEAGSKTIKIDQIRQLGDFIQQTAHQTGAWKVVLLCPAEAMGIAAANSLLKNLEEPPGRVLFLLLTDIGAHLLPTLRSRCQPLVLGDATQEQSLQWLAEHTSADQADVQQALALAPGAPLLALQLLEQGVPTWRNVLAEQLREMEQGRLSPLEVARHCEKLGGQSAAPYAIHFLQTWLRDRIGSVSAKQSDPAAALRLLTGFHRVLQDVNQRLVSGANPNVLMNLEYVLTSWLDCHQSIQQLAAPEP